MKLIRPSAEIWEQEPGIQGIYKAIERAGRICYKSEDKITEDSAKPFVDRLVKNGHGAMLEHGTVYLKASIIYLTDDGDKVEYYPLIHYLHNKYSEYFRYEGIEYVTTNYRVLVENGWLYDLEYLCEPTEFHEKRVCVHFTSDISTLREFFRHRTMSMAQESTRYCNYSKDKFGNEITFIIPCWMSDFHLGNHYSKDIIEEYRGFENWTDNPEISELLFLYSLAVSEQSYFNLLSDGWQPQQARAVLPLCTKSEAVMTGFVNDWKHFFELRATEAGAKGPHPQASELANPLYEEFVRRELIK